MSFGGLFAGIGAASNTALQRLDERDARKQAAEQQRIAAEERQRRRTLDDMVMQRQTAGDERQARLDAQSASSRTLDDELKRVEIEQARAPKPMTPRPSRSTDRGIEEFDNTTGRWTPTGRRPYQAPSQRASVSNAPKPRAIPPSAIEKEIAVDNMLSNATEVQKALSAAIRNKTDVTGRAGGILPTPGWLKNANILGVGPKGGQAGVDARRVIGSLKATVAKERAGTSMTPGELDLLESYIPHDNEDETTALRKVNGFVREMQRMKENRRAAYGRYGYSAAADAEQVPDDEYDLPNP